MCSSTLLGLCQQLAGLLISRQIIGNLRESAWPYIMEQWRLATMSFKMWGALTPTANVAMDFPKSSVDSLVSDTKKNDDAHHENVQQQQEHATAMAPTPKRSIGQAELESAYYKVHKKNEIKKKTLKKILKIPKTEKSN